MTAALDGLIVLDLTNFLSGPYCAMLLGDLGADVIKVERPDGGDDARRMPPFVDGRSQTFAVWNRNKRSITADLKQPEDIELVRELALRADVLVENFRPGTLARLGLGWEALSAANPRLIWCAISGFGQTGPWADHGGLDMMAQGMSGLMAGNGPPEGEPYRLPIAITDVTAGMFSALSVMAALQARERTGQGQRIDQSLLKRVWRLAFMKRRMFSPMARALRGLGNCIADRRPIACFKPPMATSRWALPRRNSGRRYAALSTARNWRAIPASKPMRIVSRITLR